MCGGSKKPKASVAEKQAASTAKNRLEEWKSDGYRNLEQGLIKESNYDFSDAIARKSNADLEQAASQSLRYNPGNAITSAKGIQALSGAGITSQANAAVQSKKLQDSRLLQAAKIGANVATDSSNNLNSSARRGAQTALADFQNKSIVADAKGQAIGTLATTGATLGLGEYMKSTGQPSAWERTQLNVEQGRGGQGGSLKSSDLLSTPSTLASYAPTTTTTNGAQSFPYKREQITQTSF